MPGTYLDIVVVVVVIALPYRRFLRSAFDIGVTRKFILVVNVEIQTYLICFRVILVIDFADSYVWIDGISSSNRLRMRATTTDFYFFAVRCFFVPDCVRQVLDSRRIDSSEFIDYDAMRLQQEVLTISTVLSPVFRPQPACLVGE